jgi:hypothetical protein
MAKYDNSMAIAQDKIMILMSFCFIEMLPKKRIILFLLVIIDGFAQLQQLRA